MSDDEDFSDDESQSKLKGRKAEKRKSDDDARATLVDSTGPAHAKGEDEGEADADVGGEHEGDEAAEGKLRMDKFAFDDEKPKKKAKKAHKQKPKARPKRSEYIATLTALNGILAELRKSVVGLDKENSDRNQKLVEAHEMDNDVAEYLERVLKKSLEKLEFEKNFQLEMIEKRKNLDKDSESRINELEKDFEDHEDQLYNEIEMLTLQFETLCSFDQQDADVLYNMSNLELEYKKSEKAFQDHLYELQKRNVVIRKNTDTEAELRFNRLIEDFTEFREVCNAAYTRRLLSENSALRKKYNKLVPKNFKKERDLQLMKEKFRPVNEKLIVVRDITNRLQATQEKRLDLLKKLTIFYDFYKTQIVQGSKYHRLFEALKEEEIDNLTKYRDEKVLEDDIKECVDALHEKYSELKEAENEYLQERRRYDLFVDSVKDAAFSICGLLEYDHLFPTTFLEYDSKRSRLLRGLTDLLTEEDQQICSEAMLKAKYYKGYLGLMPLDYSVCRTDLKCLKSSPSFCLGHDENEDLGVVKKMSPKFSDPAMLCVQ